VVRAMPAASRTLYWYLLVGTRGGPNRIRILELLRENPHNAHQLSERLTIDYRTIRHHLNLLETNGLVLRPVGRGYAAPYELAPDVAVRFEELRSSGTGGRSLPRPGPRAEAPARARAGT
jgi:DNA-binding transcriptional ArsR family regulator